MARHVREGDWVTVTAGNDRGKRGRILRVLSEEDRVVVEGVNRRKRHVRPSQQNPRGGRLDQEMPIHISNVSPISPSTDRPTRVRFEEGADGSKKRVAVHGGDTLSVLRKSKG